MRWAVGSALGRPPEGCAGGGGCEVCMLLVVAVVRWCGCKSVVVLLVVVWIHLLSGVHHPRAGLAVDEADHGVVHLCGGGRGGGEHLPLRSGGGAPPPPPRPRSRRRCGGHRGCPPPAGGDGGGGGGADATYDPHLTDPGHTATIRPVSQHQHPPACRPSKVQVVRLRLYLVVCCSMSLLRLVQA